MFIFSNNVLQLTYLQIEAVLKIKVRYLVQMTLLDLKNTHNVNEESSVCERGTQNINFGNIFQHLPQKHFVLTTFILNLKYQCWVKNNQTLYGGL